MEANSRRYASAAFFPEKTTLLMLSRPQRWSGHLGKNRRIACPCRKLNQDSSDDQSVTQALYRLSYSGTALDDGGGHYDEKYYVNQIWRCEMCIN